MREHKSIFGYLFLAQFFASLSAFFLIYIHSSFLTQFISEELVGIVFIIGAVFAILILMGAPFVLRRFGNYYIALLSALLTILILLGIASTENAIFAIILLVFYIGLMRVIGYTLDIFLEKYSTDEKSTGEIRGSFLTFKNVALLISPFLVGLILTNSDYWKIYLVAAFFLFLFVITISYRFRNFTDIHYDTFRLRDSLRCVLGDKDIYSTFMSQFLLRIFFAWTQIYIPIYLHFHIGLSWTAIGIIFSISLLPYILLEYPLGKISDVVWGEKEIMTIGFIILALFTAMISFVTSSSIIVWALVLFATRIGASAIDITTETHFFRYVDGTDTNTISLFRMIAPASTIAGALLGTVVLLVIPIQYSFLVLALVALYGVHYSLALKDSR